MRLYHPPLRFVVPSVAAVLWLLVPSVAQAEIEIYDADAFVQSEKRGVSANSLSDADFHALGLGVSWWYSWSPTPSSTPPADVDMEFVPMVWGSGQWSLDSLSNYLAAGNTPRQVLAINEPNLKSQSNMTPEQSATLYQQVKAIADQYNIPVSGPQMAAGSAPDDSITAIDPDTGQPVTYTYMGPFVEDFLTHSNGNTVDSIGYHFYGNSGEFSWLLGEAKQLNNGRPIWITEFNWSAAPDVNGQVDYMIQVVDQMENDPDVEAYAWFKERGAGETYDLLNATPGELSWLGWIYVNLPVHDEDVWYRPNGRLQAERYVEKSGMNIATSGDTDGIAEMTSSASNAWMDYNIYVEDAGQYEVSLRLAGQAGLVRLRDGNGQELDGLYMYEGAWRTDTLTIELESGYNTLRLEFQNAGQLINWLEFELISAIIPGDLDGDGFVGLSDLDIVLSNWNQAVTPGDLLAGDPSGNGYVGLGDLDIVLNNWNTGSPPATYAVPEPAGLALFGISGSMVLHRRS